VESRLLLTGGLSYSDHLNFDGLTFAIVGEPGSGPKFRHDTEGGRAVASIVGERVAIGKQVDYADFASRFAPLLYLNNGGNDGRFVKLFTGTAGTTGTMHGEFSTDGNIQGYYAGGYQALFRGGAARTLYVGQLTSPGGSTLTNAGGATIGYGGVQLTVSNLELDVQAQTLRLRGTASIDALSNATNASVAGVVRIDTGGRINIDNLTGTVRMGAGQVVTAGPITFSNGSLAVEYDALDQEIELAGAVSIGQAAGGTKLDVTLGTVSGSDITVPGVTIRGGRLTGLNGSVRTDAVFRAGGVTFQPASLLVSYDADQSTLELAGAASLSWGSGTSAGKVDVQLGDPGMNRDGLVIRDGALESLTGTVAADFSLLGLTFAVDRLTVGYRKATSDLTIYGGVAVSNNDPAGKTFRNLSARLGDAAAPGIVVRGGSLESLNVSVSGAFDLHGVGLAADNLTVHYDATTNDLALSGRVEVDLTDAIEASVNLPNRGITINTRTGVFVLNGLELNFSLHVGPFELRDARIAYTSTTTGYTVAGSAAIVLPGTRGIVAGKFRFVDGRLADIGMSYDAGSGSGIVLTEEPPVYLTHLGGELDNLNDPSRLVASLDAAITVGGLVSFNSTRYSVVAASGRLTVTPGSLSLEGEVRVISAGSTGLLGQGSGRVNLDWERGLYTASVDVSLYDGAFHARGDLSITDTGDLTLIASADLTIPHHVPWVGGKRLADAHFYLQVRPHEPAEKTYAKAWVSVTLIGTVGIEYNLKTGFDWFRGTPTLEATGSRSDSTYSTRFDVGSNVNDVTVTISSPEFRGASNASWAPSLARGGILVIGPGLRIWSASLQGYPALPDGGPVDVDQVNGKLVVSLRHLTGTTTTLPRGGYTIYFGTDRALPQSPTFRFSPTYRPPSLNLINAGPGIDPATGMATISLLSSAFTTGTNISMFRADTPTAGTSARGEDGELIGTFPAYYYASTRYDLPTGNGYVLYNSFTPYAVVWTTCPAAAQADGRPSYLYGVIDDGTNSPVRSPQTFEIRPPDPTPKLGEVAPVVMSFQQVLNLPAPSLTGMGQWPLQIEIIDNAGHAALGWQPSGGPQPQKAAGTSPWRSALTYRTLTSDPYGEAHRFFAGLKYFQDPAIRDFPGYASVTIRVTALVGPKAEPFTAERTIELSRPNADLVVEQSVVRHISPPTGGRELATITIRVTNRRVAGSQTATNVVVTDRLPKWVAVQAWAVDPGRGTFDPTKGRWSIGTLGVGQTATLRLTVIYTGPALDPGTGAHLRNTVIASCDQVNLRPQDSVDVHRLPWRFSRQR
jgi:hypothetical protein